MAVIGGGLAQSEIFLGCLPFGNFVGRLLDVIKIRVGSGNIGHVTQHGSIQRQRPGFFDVGCGCSKREGVAAAVDDVTAAVRIVAFQGVCRDDDADRLALAGRKHGGLGKARKL